MNRKKIKLFLLYFFTMLFYAIGIWFIYFFSHYNKCCP